MRFVLFFVLIVFFTTAKSWSVSPVENAGTIAGYILYYDSIGTSVKDTIQRKEIVSLRFICTLTSPITWPKQHDVIAMQWPGMPATRPLVTVKIKADGKPQSAILWHSIGQILHRSLPRSKSFVDTMGSSRSISVDWNIDSTAYSAVFNMLGFSEALGDFTLLCDSK